MFPGSTTRRVPNRNFLKIINVCQFKNPIFFLIRKIIIIIRCYYKKGYEKFTQTVIGTMLQRKDIVKPASQKIFNEKIRPALQNLVITMTEVLINTTRAKREEEDKASKAGQKKETGNKKGTQKPIEEYIALKQVENPELICELCEAIAGDLFKVCPTEAMSLMIVCVAETNSKETLAKLYHKWTELFSPSWNNRRAEWTQCPDQLLHAGAMELLALLGQRSRHMLIAGSDNSKSDSKGSLGKASLAPGMVCRQTNKSNALCVIKAVNAATDRYLVFSESGECAELKASELKPCDQKAISTRKQIIGC
jgi:hypothetical protein